LGMPRKFTVVCPEVTLDVNQGNLQGNVRAKPVSMQSILQTGMIRATAGCEAVRKHEQKELGVRRRVLTWHCEHAATEE
jgi:hypothetical protein